MSRVVFMGTPEFSVGSLRAVAEQHDVCAVITNPDRRSGRGKKLNPPPVKVAALELGIEVLQPPKLRDREVFEKISGFAPDFFVVVAYGAILGPRYLAIPKIAPVNVHASLLPKFRGSAPIHWAIVRGEAETGVGIMRMERGMDTGGVYLERALAIEPNDTAGTLHDRLAVLGAELIVEALPLIESGALTAIPQDPALASVAPMLKKADGAVRFEDPAKRVHDRIRGMHPWPGAFCRFRGKYLKIHSAEMGSLETTAEPGSVVALDDSGLTVSCGAGSTIVLKELQFEGKSRASARDIIHGYKVLVGERLEPDPAVLERRD